MPETPGAQAVRCECGQEVCMTYRAKLWVDDVLSRIVVAVLAWRRR